MKSFVNLHSQIFDQVVVHLSSLPEIDYKQKSRTAKYWNCYENVMLFTAKRGQGQIINVINCNVIASDFFSNVILCNNWNLRIKTVDVFHNTLLQCYTWDICVYIKYPALFCNYGYLPLIELENS